MKRNGSLKLKMPRIIRAMLPAMLLVDMLCTPAAAAGSAVVSLRVEGADKTLYYDSALPVAYTADATMRDVVDTYNDLPDVPVMTVQGGGADARIVSVGDLSERSLGSPFSDCWMLRLNGEKIDRGLDVTRISAGDDIVVYYGDASLFQYPEIDLTRMITEGVVTFTSSDATKDASGASYVTSEPVAGATVVWDGMTYTTDPAGEIIIDSTGAGVRHTVSIERRYTNGMPTVLRFAPGYYVKYGYHDVTKDDWYYDAVMFVSDRQLMSGATETDFQPGTPVNRAMFLTILGRLAGAEVDHSEAAGRADIVNDGWSAGYIVWALQNGVAGLKPDGTFGQYEILSREEIAAMLFNLAAMSGSDVGLPAQDMSVYSDIGAVSQNDLPAMAWAAGHGILTGVSGRLEPGGPATRAQVAAMLQRYIREFMK
jgi:hypothetical protein